ncbi:MAG: ectoine hydroxylase-related dioxygenase (phytanoyl-CoA dioxygenase family) [Flavobacterium sp.]|jgi:ectoine hydroxylase-related dioxygenase (phytanoyl-CoA dioxygenase family)
MSTQPEYPIVINENQIKRYQEQGFLLTPQVLTQSEIKNYGAAVDREVAVRTSGDKREVSEKTKYEQSFIQCMRLWETSRDIQPLTFHAGLAGIAAQLMGVEKVRLWQDQALYKEPGGADTEAHQDQTFWPIGDVPLVSAWIPFQAIEKQNGAMAYVPKSHSVGPLKVVNITRSTTPYPIVEDPALGGEKPEWVLVDSGSVVWHSGFTVHQAAANNTDQTRRVFTVVYFADGFKRLRNSPAFPLDRAGVNVGELMEGEGLPILWPPSPSLPKPPNTHGQMIGPQYGS